MGRSVYQAIRAIQRGLQPRSGSKINAGTPARRGHRCAGRCKRANNFAAEQAATPVTTTFIGLRSRTPEGTASLSGFTQSMGYLLAAVGPFGVGTLHDLTGGWTAPLVLLTALALPQIWLGLYVARPAYIEDQLPARGSRTISDVAGAKPPRA